MAELQEKRDYYSDRSVKSVYLVDKHGKKQGEYTTYEQNSDKVKETGKYVDDVVRYSKRGNEETFYDEEGKKEKVLKDGKLCQEYKDGKPWNGNFVSVNENYDEYGDGGSVVKSGIFKDGKLYDGSWITRNHSSSYIAYRGRVHWDSEKEIPYMNGEPNGDASFRSYTDNELSAEAKAQYVDGVLNGDYKSEGCFVFLDEYIGQFNVYIGHKTDKLLLERLPKEVSNTYIHWLENASAEGKFTNGKFSGHIHGKHCYSTYDAQYEDGKLTSLTKKNGNSGELKYKCIYDGDKIISLDYCNPKSHGEKEEIHIKCKYDGDKLVEMDCNGEKITLTYNGNEHVATDVFNGPHHKHEEKNGKCYSKMGDVVTEEYSTNNWEKEGTYRKYNNVKGWLEQEADYKDGKLNGIYKEYNSDKTVAALKHYNDGTEDTATYLKARERREVLRKIVAEKIDERDAKNPNAKKERVIKNKTLTKLKVAWKARQEERK